MPQPKKVCSCRGRRPCLARARLCGGRVRVWVGCVRGLGAGARAAGHPVRLGLLKVHRACARVDDAAPTRAGYTPPAAEHTPLHSPAGQAKAPGDAEEGQARQEGKQPEPLGDSTLGDSTQASAGVGGARVPPECYGYCLALTLTLLSGAPSPSRVLGLPLWLDSSHPRMSSSSSWLP